MYTIDPAHSPENRITGILAPTADRILEMFLSQDDDIVRPFEALFYACYVGKRSSWNSRQWLGTGIRYSSRGVVSVGLDAGGENRPYTVY